MSVKLHRQAEQLMAEADLLEIAGKPDEAASRWLEAAQTEAQVFELIPEDRRRTRGIIAVSAVALFRRAGALDEAIRSAYGFLATGDLLEAWQSELESLLDRARQERQARRTGRTLGTEGLEVSLRGGLVGTGLAPADLVAVTLQRIGKYALRLGEWIADEDFREKGSPAPGVAQMVNPLVSQPVSGSFQFQLRFETPLQPALPGFEIRKPITPDALTRAFFDVTDAISQNIEEQLSSLVTNIDYRIAFLKLIRNLVPDGSEVAALEIRRTGGRSNDTAVLTPSTRSFIQQQLAFTSVSNAIPGVEDTGYLTGVLRALDLDSGLLWLNENGVERRHKCRAATKGAMLDDVVTPLVNRRVSVRGRWVRRTFVVQDIFEDGSPLLTDPSPVMEIR